MNTQVIDRAAAMLYPEAGVRARDVKFFFHGCEAPTQDVLAEQVILALTVLNDSAYDLTDVD